jgi:hypothetical protein
MVKMEALLETWLDHYRSYSFFPRAFELHRGFGMGHFNLLELFSNATSYFLSQLAIVARFYVALPLSSCGYFGDDEFFDAVVFL